MLEFRTIDVDEVKTFVNASFNWDAKLNQFCNPVFFFEKTHLTNEQISNEVSSMIIQYKNVLDSSLTIIGIETIEKNEVKPIGFVVMSKKLSNLYSFGVNIKYRNAVVLSSLFDTIRYHLKEFNCIMNKRNERAINWLKRCGMEILSGAESDENTIYLTYKIN